MSYGGSDGVFCVCLVCVVGRMELKCQGLLISGTLRIQPAHWDCLANHTLGENCLVIVITVIIGSAFVCQRNKS